MVDIGSSDRAFYAFNFLAQVLGAQEAKVGIGVGEVGGVSCVSNRIPVGI